MSYWIVYSLILIVGLAVLTSPFFLFRRGGRQPGRVQILVENMALALLMLFFTGMALEFYFKVFFAQSDGFGYTLASQNWYNRYWQENSLGYRDVEWTPEKLAGKTKVMVVGDSFVAGSGVARVQDRFANQLGRLLGEDYAVLNVASPGWDTIDEVKAILGYPHRPDVIILSYYINDIEGVAYESGAQRPALRRDPPGWLLPLVQNSYMINFLYWRLIRLGPQEWATAYWSWLREINENPDIQWRHRQELLTIIQSVASEKIPLFVVVFPNLTAMEESQFITRPVIDLFEEHHVPVLDVSTLLAGRSPAEITVNSVDAHPSESVNLEVAQALYRMMGEHNTD